MEISMGCSWQWSLWVLISILCVAVKLFDSLWWKPRRIEQHFSKQGIRGPPYKIFYGNVEEMAGLMVTSAASSIDQMTPQPSPHDILPRVLPFYHHWKNTYGSPFLLWFGRTPRVAVSDPELAREILLSRSEWYDKYEPHPLVRKLEGEESLLSLSGEKWVLHRKLLAPIFHMDNLNLVVSMVGRTAADMVEKWSAEMAISASTGEAEIDVLTWYQSFVQEVNTRAVFGLDYKEGKTVFHLQAKQMALAAETFGTISIPGCRFLPTKKNMESWKLEREMREALRDVIEIRKMKEKNSDQPSGSAKDVLGILIGAATSSSSSRGDGAIVTIHEVMEECRAFFFTATHTTVNLLAWTTLLLAMHPEWQDKARDEVVKVCGSRDVPTRDNVAKLKMLGMIVNESLRLYPPAVAMIRKPRVNVELGGRYQIPRGTELMIPIMAVHHDQDLWGTDAAEFNPARFGDGVARAARHPTAFIPFGFGPRTCVGQNLAVLEAKITLAIVLLRFTFSVSPSYVHAPTVLMILQPQHGAPVVFRPIQ